MTKRIIAAIALFLIATTLLAACTSAAGTASSTTSTEIPSAATPGVSLPSGTGAPPAGMSGPGGPPPNGTPPGGMSGPGGAPPGGAGGPAGLATATGVYTLDGGTETQTGQAYNAANADQSAVYVTNSATLALVDPTVSKTGDTSSSDSSSFYGLNAAILAASGSQVTITGGTVTTNAAGANGVFSQGSGTAVSVADMTIYAAGDGAHAVMATQGGSMILSNVQMTTTNSHSGAIATDRGGGAITATNVTVLTTGQDSPAIYSTGTIMVSSSTLTATGAEAAVVEGANSITLADSSLSSSMADKWGVMIYQSFSGDAQGSKGVFTMTGGSLTYTSPGGPLFYVTNSIGYINLKGVDVTAPSRILLEAAGDDRWGTSGANGGTAILTFDTQSLTGELFADPISSITATLQNSSALTGTIDTFHTAKAVNLALDASSSWNVTGDSYLTCLDDPGGISGTAVTNITGNGHTVYYDAGACSALGGQSYTLNGGGMLQPGP